MEPWLQALIDQFKASQPNAVFQNLFGGAAGANSNAGRYVQGQQGNYQNEFLGRLINDPTLQWEDYLKKKNPLQEFNMLAPSQRGENTGLFNPRVQYVPRRI